MPDARPSILVWSSLFPGPAQPQAGVFVRERMFRVAKELPLTVISPQPWFPMQGLLRRFRPHFRPEMPRREVQQGIEVLRPRYFSVPGVLKRLDGYFMAAGALPTVRRLRQAGRADVIDAHFAYPDGYAAVRAARAVQAPVAITLRGTEVRHASDDGLRGRLVVALRGADRVFAVSDSLRRLALELGLAPEKVLVVGNGVDSERFRPEDAEVARRSFGLDSAARVLVTVGGLVERKGFHRVIECLPELLQSHPTLQYLVVGAPGPEGDYSRELRSQVSALGLQDRVHFVGALPPESVRRALSASDVFVLASRNEGWANVLLEAMACGVPVVASDVGGNREVVCTTQLGRVVRFGDREALSRAIDDALRTDWDRAAIRRHAERNDWQQRVSTLLDEFRRLAPGSNGRRGEQDTHHG